MTNLPAGIRTSFMPTELATSLAAPPPRTGPWAIQHDASRQAGMRSAITGIPLQQLPGPEADREDRRRPGNDGAGPRAAPPHVQDVKRAQQKQHRQADQDRREP